MVPRSLADDQSARADPRRRASPPTRRGRAGLSADGGPAAGAVAKSDAARRSNSTPAWCRKSAGRVAHAARLPDGAAGLARRAFSQQRCREALAARRRFVYEEFLVLQLALAVRRRRSATGNRPRAAARRRRSMPTSAGCFRSSSPPIRTGRSPKSARTWPSDRPMQRLLQADVGAGKTAVAVYALLVAVANKHQAAIYGADRSAGPAALAHPGGLSRPQPGAPPAADRRA